MFYTEKSLCIKRQMGGYTAKNLYNSFYLPNTSPIIAQKTSKISENSRRLADKIKG
jgi:hypothetical protein